MKNHGALSLIITAIYSFGVGVSAEFSPLFALPILLLFCLKKIAVLNLLKKIFFLNLFVAFAVFSVMLTRNYELALLIALRANLIMLFNLMLFAGLKEEQIAGLFSELKFSAKFVSLVYFSLFFVEILRRELGIRLLALWSRGAGRGLFRLKAYANIVALLVILALKKSTSLELTLKARGFKSQILWGQKFRAFGAEIFLLICVIICVILPYLEFL